MLQNHLFDDVTAHCRQLQHAAGRLVKAKTTNSMVKEEEKNCTVSLAQRGVCKRLLQVAALIDGRKGWGWGGEVNGSDQPDFRTLVFFSYIDPTWATDRWVEIFFILVKNLPSYSNFSISPGYDTPESQSPRSIIPRRVNTKFAKTWLPGIS